MSPASSVHSLPVSPGTEKQLLSKDVTKGERSSLMLQLKEKDDLILKLQDELAKAQSLEKSVSHRMDKSTQTEIIGHDVICLNRPMNQNLNSRDRRLVHTPIEDQFSRPSSDRPVTCESKICQAPSLYFSNLLKQQEASHAPQHKTAVPTASLTHNHRGSRSDTSSLYRSKSNQVSDTESFPVVSACQREKIALPKQHSTFKGRLGQPPRGPLSLHMYSRKNVFLQHTLQTAELQSLSPHDV
ncbi:serine-rich coiled-coil domain-containing protein 1-like isoform X1 [Polyodon spathula]|uniref:serine-rich coiled-coil domain-containing protein 1-like isoform X1 n=1 Tax=Polyodon spathula TaxID=7913 RepID=UPI001B7E86BC|nr:serine-rich coiled-coil domain-containing protein 1-like isoform X1 [Polyodon spathula]